MPNLFYLAIAALSGAAMAFQGTLNAALGKILGVWESTLIVHIIGTVTSLAIIIILGVGFGGLNKVGSAPWWAYLGGLLNVIIIYAVVRSMPQIGVGNATTAIIVAQLITAFCIDCTGAFGMKKIPFQYIDLLGIVLLAVGARILFME
ncbi:MAG: DMT family transporter [Syntrophomonadaceae bacterium]|nr:DMT family transporter [Syntrophomonadaceae bacterium]